MPSLQKIISKGITGGITTIILGAVGTGIAIISPWFPIKNSQSQSIYQLGRPVNILVMGIDLVPDAKPGSQQVFAGRSDTMLLVRLDPEDNTINILSIPRDTRVKIPEKGYNKVNSANAFGGASSGAILAAQTVNQNLYNIPIDRYARITPNVFVELVDLVGGIEVNVEKRMYYVDRTQNLTIDLQPGLQILNGDQAQQYVRFRNDELGDIGRAQRQQIALKALQKRLQSPTIIFRIPQLLRVIDRNLDTNLSTEEILAAASFGKSLPKDKISTHLLPGRFSTQREHRTSFWIINDNKTAAIMAEFFDVEVPEDKLPRNDISPSRLRIAIQNAADPPDLAEKVRNKLQSDKWKNTYLLPESKTLLLRETQIIVQQGNLEAGKMVQETLGFGRIEVSSTGELSSDLTIRVGVDAGNYLENKL